MGYSCSYVLHRLAVPFAIIGFMFTIFGLPSVGWYTHTGTTKITIGLFIYCLDDKCIPIEDISNSQNIDFSYLDAVVALISLGCICGFTCLIVMVLYLAVKKRKWRNTFYVCATALSCLSGCFILLGVVVFGAKTEFEGSPDLRGGSFYYGYSFALTVTGGLSYIMAGIVLLFDKLFEKITEDDDDLPAITPP